MTSTEVRALSAHAAARSALYRLLAEALAFPSAELAASVAAGRFLTGLERELDVLRFAPALDGDARAAISDPALTREEMEAEYIRLFEVGPGRPPCPPYEGSHRSGRMKIMEELVRFYDYFGLRTLPGDLPDHLCAELEFLHYLTFREAETGGLAQRSYRLAQRDFLERHLCRWLPRLRLRLEAAGPSPFYRSLIGFVADFCAGHLAAAKGAGQSPTNKSGPARLTGMRVRDDKLSDHLTKKG